MCTYTLSGIKSHVAVYILSPLEDSDENVNIVPLILEMQHLKNTITYTYILVYESLLSSY